MHDIKSIRANPEQFDAALARRFANPWGKRVVELDSNLRSIKTQLQSKQANVTTLSARIAKAYREGRNADDMVEESRALGSVIPQLEDEENRMVGRLNAVLQIIPNIPLAEVPDGRDAQANREVRRWGKPRTDIVPSHDEIGRRLGLIDTEAAVAISGERFTFLKGALAALERVLGNFMIEMAGEQGFEEVSPPLIVNYNALFGTGQLPKFENDLYGVAQGTTKVPNQVLIPTAEVPLTNMVRGKIIADLSSPLCYAALTPCFRAEGGSAGRDTVGHIRQHQFYKCELVTICKPSSAEAAHDHLLACAEKVLQDLELPYRVVELCCGDLGFSSQRTYALEVWFPSQGMYREISSVSRCGDFQARRMNARYRDDNGRSAFVHTLNGSGVAVGRALAAIMENNWEDGRFMVPTCLRDRLHQREWI